jgi:hypothetical protein
MEKKNRYLYLYLLRFLGLSITREAIVSKEEVYLLVKQFIQGQAKK